MRTLIKLSSYLKWIGLLGIPMFIYDAPIWKMLWAFWLFAIIEILLTLPIVIQSLGQLVAMIIIPLIHRPVPNLLNYKNKVEYSLPFTGEWLVVNGGVDKALSHSWGINSQRYAYDFIKTDNQLKSYKDDRKKLDNYYSYGRDIIAPADGMVVELSNKSKDSKMMWHHSTDPLIRDIRGNYIVIKHSDNEYSFIAHIKPNSFLVQKGDQVKRYQKLAECGNSGNSTEPHIHFHIQNRKGFVLSAGLPVKFKNIKVQKVKEYKNYDPRPTESKFDYSTYQNRYIHRGLLVSNFME